MLKTRFWEYSGRELAHLQLIMRATLDSKKVFPKVISKIPGNSCTRFHHP